MMEKLGREAFSAPRLLLTKLDRIQGNSGQFRLG
jgi:hypothetical protein